MQDLIARYLSDLEAQGKMPLTRKAYASDVRGLWRYLEREGLSLTQLGRAEMRTYLRQLVARYEPGTVHRKIHGARGFLRWCIEEGVLQEDPAKGIVLGRLPDKDPSVVTDEEVEKILRAARRDLHALAALSLLAYTGARRFELLGALWGDVDLVRRTWRIRGKGGHNRTVPLIGPVVEVLLALRSGDFSRPEDRLLQNRYGQPLGKDALRKLIIRYAREAGISHRITPHAFRHGVATRLAAQGVDPFTIASILGHRDLATTQRYVHPGVGQQRDALQALAIRETAAATLPQSQPAWSQMENVLQAALAAAAGEYESSENSSSLNFLRAFAQLILRLDSRHDEQSSDLAEGN